MTVNPYSALSYLGAMSWYETFKYKEKIGVVIESESGPERSSQYLLTNNEHGSA